VVLTIHSSERVIYTLRRIPDRLVYRSPIWSFESSAYSHCSDGSYMDVRTASEPCRVVVPFGSEVVVALPRVDWPEFRLRLRTYWDPGLLAEQVWRLAVQGVRGFRIAGEFSHGLNTDETQIKEATPFSGPCSIRVSSEAQDSELYALVSEQARGGRGQRR